MKRKKILYNSFLILMLASFVALILPLVLRFRVSALYVSIFSILMLVSPLIAKSYE